MAAYKKKVKIRHAGFTYHKRANTIMPSGEIVAAFTPVTALRDEEITLEFEGDYQRGLEEDAFYTDDHHPVSGVPLAYLREVGEIDEDEDVDEDEVVDIDNATDEELMEFVNSSNIATVLEVADNPERARRLLQAEGSSTGHDPRKTLVEELERRVEPEA